MSTYEFIVSMVGLLVVGSLGTVMAYRKAKSGRERIFLFKAVGLQAVLAIGVLTAYYHFQWSQPFLVLIVVLTIFLPVMLLIDRRARRIRAQHDGTNA